MADLRIGVQLEGIDEAVASFKRLEGALANAQSATAANVAPANREFQAMQKTLVTGLVPAFSQFEGVAKKATFQLAGLATGLASGQGVIRSFGHSAVAMISTFTGPWGVALAAGAAAVAVLLTRLDLFPNVAALAIEGAESYSGALDALAEALDRASESERRHAGEVILGARAQIEAALATQKELLAAQQDDQSSLLTPRRGMAPVDPTERTIGELDIESTKNRILELTSALSLLTQTSAHLRDGPLLDLSSGTEALGAITAATADKIGSVIEALQFETDQLTRSAEEQGFYNQLKRAGIDANSAWAASIEEANSALFRQRDAITDLNAALAEEEAQRSRASTIHVSLMTPAETADAKLSEGQELNKLGLLSDADLARLKEADASLVQLTASGMTFGQVVGGAFRDAGNILTQGLRSGADAFDILKEIGLAALNQLISKMLQMSTIDPFAGAGGVFQQLLGGSKTGSIFGQLLDGVLGAFAGAFGGGTSQVPAGLGASFSGNMVTGYASGGSRVFTRPSLISVAENGPEQVNVVPSAGMPGDAARAGLVQNFYVDARGSNGDESIERAVARGIKSAYPSFVASSLKAVGDRHRRDPSYLRGR